MNGVERQKAEFRNFRAFGFRVEVRPGFLVFLALVVFIYGGTLGLWAAGTIAVFTLIHELGHATAARATGAHAEISLDFLAGYASYLPRRPLARWERAGIAAAGPLSQFISGCFVMLLLGANPFSRADILMNEATVTVWWAGIVLALVNLIPVLPLDGGAIVSAGLERIAPRRGDEFMLWFSIVASSAGVAFAITIPELQGFLPFAAILLVMQIQILATRRKAYAVKGKAYAVNSKAYATISAEMAQLAPSEGDIHVLRSLQLSGQHKEAAALGAEMFRKCPRGEIAALIATSLTHLGDHDGAQAWMRAAEQASLARH